MAYLTGTLVSDGRIRWQIDGLEHVYSAYDQFYISTNDGKSITWSDGTNYDYTNGHACGITVHGIAYARYAGVDYYAGEADIPTQACIVLPPTGTPSVGATALAGKQISVSWTSVSGATGYNVLANDFYKISSSSTSATISIDSEYTLYTIKVYPYNSAGTGSNFGITTVRSLDETWPVITSFYYSSLQATQVTINASAYDPSLGTGLTNMVLYRNNSPIFSTSSSTTNFNYTDTGLLQNTTYTYVLLVVDGAGHNQLTSGSSNITIKTPKARPIEFDWTNSHSTGSDINLYATEWNLLQAKVNEFRDYKGFPLYAFSNVSSGIDMTAAQFNIVRDKIADMSPPVSVPASVTAGVTDIYWSDVDRLRLSLKSII